MDNDNLDDGIGGEDNGCLLLLIILAIVTWILI